MHKGSSTTPRTALFLFFLVSGFCSLVYEVVWLRLAYAAFGVNTVVMSVVISVFMAGLALGSWLGGRWIGTLTRNRSALRFYGGAEAVIAAGAFAVPLLFDSSQRLLLSVGPTNSLPYLALSGLLCALALLPWTFAMGATFPFAMAFIRQRGGADRGGFSFLYLANVIGAMTGVLSTAVLWVELFGLRGTLVLAAFLNVAIAVLAFLAAYRFPASGGSAEARAAAPGKSAPAALLGALFLTGFSSMGMEVAWVRNFTPVLGNLIYSFAWILTVYLLATWIGSALYRHDLSRRAAPRSPSLLMGLAGLLSLLPILATDPRLVPGATQVLASIFPFCLVLGYLTPSLVDACSGGDPARAGRAYAFNIIGCIMGPLLASYLLLPLGGVQAAVAFLAVPLITMFPVLAGRTPWRLPHSTLLGAGVTALVLSIYPAASFDTMVGTESPVRVVLRDHTATAVACGEGRNRKLYVNGIGLTVLTPLTKVMAHLPLFCLEHRPERGLVICFGMGTTFRSMAAWGIDTTAVELVPSVARLFAFYHADGPALLTDPRFRVVVDDGRRYLMRSRLKYDVITLDPPPPVEAAGSSLLYSREFYRLVKSRLSEGGILQQWLPPAEYATGQATLRALVETFPYVRAYLSIADWGLHFLASERPITVPSLDTIRSRMPRKAQEDMVEWRSLPDLALFRADLDRRELSVPRLLNPDPSVVLTDDRPHNEYFLVRRTLRRLFGEKEMPLMGK